MKNKVIILLIVVIMLISFINLDINLNKTPIQEATYRNLTDIEDIGHVLATRILSELESNKYATIEDIDDVQGIGPKRIKNIKKVYK